MEENCLDNTSNDNGVKQSKIGTILNAFMWVDKHISNPMLFYAIKKILFLKNAKQITITPEKTY